MLEKLCIKIIFSILNLDNSALTSSSSLRFSIKIEATLFLSQHKKLAKENKFISI